MNLIFFRIDNLVFNKKEVYDFIPEKVSEELNMMAYIQYLSEKNKSFDFKMNKLIEKTSLKYKIGEIKYSSLLEKPALLYLIPTNEDFDIPPSKYDEFYLAMDYQLSTIARMFSLCVWLLKDSCVSLSHAYHVNIFNECISEVNIDYTCTKANGEISPTELTKREISQAVEWVYELFPFVIQEKENIKEIETNKNGLTTHLSVEKAISPNNRSYLKALLSLQEARKSGLLPLKIEKYCTCLETIFSIRKQHKKNLKNIVASQIGKNSNEMETIRDDFKWTYGIRSDYSHGDRLKYLNHYSQDELTELVMRVDSYVRKIMEIVLFNKSFNYLDTDEVKKAEVRNFFLKKAKETFPDDY